MLDHPMFKALGNEFEPVTFQLRSARIRLPLTSCGGGTDRHSLAGISVRASATVGGASFSFCAAVSNALAASADPTTPNLTATTSADSSVSFPPQGRHRAAKSTAQHMHNRMERVLKTSWDSV